MQSFGVHWPLTCSNSGVWNKTFLNRTEECHVCYVLWFVACIRGLKWDYIEKKGAFIVLMLAKMVCLRAWRCTVELFSDISLPFYLFSFSSSLSNPCSFFSNARKLTSSNVSSRSQLSEYWRYQTHLLNKWPICGNEDVISDSKTLSPITEYQGDHAPIWHFWHTWCPR